MGCKNFCNFPLLWAIFELLNVINAISSYSSFALVWHSAITILADDLIDNVKVGYYSRRLKKSKWEKSLTLCIRLYLSSIRAGANVAIEIKAYLKCL